MHPFAMTTVTIWNGNLKVIEPISGFMQSLFYLFEKAMSTAQTAPNVTTMQVSRLTEIRGKSAIWSTY